MTFSAPSMVRASIVTIDAGAPHAIEIAPEDFAAFREIAAAVSVERAWERIAAGAEMPGDLADVGALPRLPHSRG